MAYRQFAESIYHSAAFSAEEEQTTPAISPSELEIQQLWAKGMLIGEGKTEHHGRVRILDVGQWNRGSGADFLRAEIEIEGKTKRGDIEIDRHAQDWERHEHGSNPAFNEVVLHVVLSPPPQGWYTRDSLHREIPVLYLAPSAWQQALGLSHTTPSPLPLPRCSAPLATLPPASIQSLLQAAAAHRISQKRKIFRAKVHQQGEEQTWYEALAETLGYSANKEAMRLLAARAPLKQLAGREEALLFGVAGFLLPMLPETSDNEARKYHRSVWDAWWPMQQDFALNAGREIPWVYAATRPQNHPHRRVAALATAVKEWNKLFPLFTASGVKRLAERLANLRHPYWDMHYTLPSAPAKKRMAMIGLARINDFLINHVYVQDESEASWHSYLSIKSPTSPGIVKRTAQRLFGQRQDILAMLQHAYAQQAILQIDADFCAGSGCRDCLFPEQLAQWRTPPSCSEC